MVWCYAFHNSLFLSFGHMILGVWSERLVPCVVLLYRHHKKKNLLRTRMCHCGSDILWPSAVTGWQFLWPACFSFLLAIICNHLELSHQVCQHRYYDREVFFISAAAAQSDLSPLSRIFDFCCCISLHWLDSTHSRRMLQPFLCHGKYM